MQDIKLDDLANVTGGANLGRGHLARLATDPLPTRQPMFGNLGRGHLARLATTPIQTLAK